PLNNRWHDYRQIGAVVAIRSFDRRRYDHKPATKLYNAWQGCPLFWAQSQPTEQPGAAAWIILKPTHQQPCSNI
ncbi:MAG: hypothetical protein AAGF01_19895, partial [Cyanobacteria bacterium P01_G01_bin.38]